MYRRSQVLPQRAQPCLLAVALAAIAATTSRDAMASACTRVRVASGGTLGARWHDAIRSLESEVAKLADDECADATVSVLSERTGSVSR